MIKGLTKDQHLRLACCEFGRNETLARQLYAFITEKPQPIKKTAKKPRAKI